MFAVRSVQADCRRRRHQPRKPPLTKIRPGSPAPAMGPGTLETLLSKGDRHVLLVERLVVKCRGKFFRGQVAVRAGRGRPVLALVGTSIRSAVARPFGEPAAIARTTPKARAIPNTNPSALRTGDAAFVASGLDGTPTLGLRILVRTRPSN
jgi:hypothetical protein